jgi:hypothetical protein
MGRRDGKHRGNRQVALLRSNRINGRHRRYRLHRVDRRHRRHRQYGKHRFDWRHRVDWRNGQYGQYGFDRR